MSPSAVHIDIKREPLHTKSISQTNESQPNRLFKHFSLNDQRAVIKEKSATDLLEHTT